ncbi:MAG: CinA family protein [Brevinemataceae bacterium]
MDNISTICSEIISVLKKSEKTLFTAESCTGGMIASSITQIPGSSSIFDGGIVSYNNNIKQKLLNVDSETLEKYGAVSFECVIEMALGAAKCSESDYILAVTGIAGPEGGSIEKPVGTVFTAVYNKNNGGWAQKFVIPGTRNEIQATSTLLILQLLLATETEQDFFSTFMHTAREIS